VTGDQRCRAVEIDPSLLQEGDVEMLQDLILTAVNTALDNLVRWPPNGLALWQQVDYRSND